MNGKVSEDVAAIREHGAQAEQHSGGDVSEQLAARIDKVEWLIEQTGRSAELTAELEGYVKDLRAELQSLRTIRFLILTGSTFLGATLLIFAGYVILCRPLLLWSLGSPARVALIAGSMAGAVLLATLVLKGVFRSIADRNTESMLPPNLATMIEAVRSIRD